MTGWKVRAEKDITLKMNSSDYLDSQKGVIRNFAIYLQVKMGEEKNVSKQGSEEKQGK